MSMNRRQFLKTAVAGVGVGASGTALALQRERLPLSPDAVGMLYDSTQCIGCKACMSACKEANGMPPEHTAQADPMWDTPVETSGDTLNVIKLYTDGDMSVKDREVNGYAFMKRHCLHCVDPSCVSVCPVSAMTKDSITGIVEHHADRCIGCRYCVYGCPFGIPKYEYDDPFGQIQKCQFCAHLQAKGELPACCDVCPTGASLFGKVSDLKAEAALRLSKQPGESHDFPRGLCGGDRPGHEGRIASYQDTYYGDRELGGTQVMYLSGVPYEKLGLPTNVPDYGYAALSEGIQHTLYKGMIAPAALFVGLVYLAKRSASNPSKLDKAEQKHEHDGEQS